MTNFEARPDPFPASRDGIAKVLGLGGAVHVMKGPDNTHYQTYYALDGIGLQLLSDSLAVSLVSFSRLFVPQQQGRGGGVRVICAVQQQHRLARGQMCLCVRLDMAV